MADNTVYLPTKAMIKELAEYLRAQIPDLNDVLQDWPNANRQMVLPTATVTSGEPDFEAENPIYGANIPDKDANLGGNPELLIKWVVGQYTWKVQLDIWARDKVQRHQIYQKLFIAMNKPFLDGTRHSLGISLNLSDYHGIFCQYILDDHKFDDGEESAQRREWRMTATILVDAKAILERDQFAILTTDVMVETPDVIEEI